jgi:hypothetical protein
MRWITLLGLVLAACSLIPRTAVAAESGNEVPFKLYRGYVIVARGSIGNLRNLNFVIDTGAVPSILDRRIAQRLHLTGAIEKLSVFTQKLDMERVIAPNVNLGPFHADALPLIVGNMSFAEEALGIRVDAVVGLDLLNQNSFTIDYQSRKLTVGPIDPSLAAIPYEAHPGYAVVEMKKQKRFFRLLLDTGAGDLFLFKSATGDFPDAITSTGTRTGSNMGGEVRIQQIELADAFLGSTPWGKRDAFILLDSAGNQPDGLSGLLGVASLKARRVGFDPKHRIFAWEAQN